MRWNSLYYDIELGSTLLYFFTYHLIAVHAVSLQLKVLLIYVKEFNCILEDFSVEKCSRRKKIYGRIETHLCAMYKHTQNIDYKMMTTVQT